MDLIAWTRIKLLPQLMIEAELESRFSATQPNIFGDTSEAFEVSLFFESYVEIL